MRFVVCCVLITLSFQAKCLEIEGEFFVGDAPNQIVVIGTAEFSRVQLNTGELSGSDNDYLIRRITNKKLAFDF